MIEEKSEQGEDREVERGVHADRDAQKPAESPRQGCVFRGHGEFRDFQAGRKKGHQRNGKRGFARYGPS